MQDPGHVNEARERIGREPREGSLKHTVSSTIPNPPVHIYSHILDTELWVVPDDWAGELDGPAYTDSEIQQLDRLEVTAAELKVIHTTKIALDGDVFPQTGQDRPGDRDDVR